ncbi:MAG: hypothetical protein M3P85_10810 [Actinomycetota bacterium]|nr:hypothetical protein [Actinomycetota bacterium]
MAPIGTTSPVRKVRPRSAIVALVALSAAILVTPPADAVVGQVRAAADYPLQPTANPGSARLKAGPGFAVNPANADHIVETHQELSTEECEFNVSFDRGVNWTGGELQAPAGYPVDLPGPCSVVGHGAGNLGQQSVGFGSGNDVYLAWTSSVAPRTSGFTVLLSRSTDGGQTFSEGVEVPGLIGGVSPGPDFFRPELAVERRAGAADRLYIATRDARTNRALVVRSDDAGLTWTAPVEASESAAAQPVFDASGNVTTAGNAYRRATEVTGPVLGPVPSGEGERPVYMAWTARRDAPPAGDNPPPCPPTVAGPSYCEGPGEIQAHNYLVVAKSTDLGVTWTRTRVLNSQGFRTVTGNPAGGFAGSNYPRIAAGPEGNVYLAFTQGPGVGPSNNCGSGPFPAGAPVAGPTNTCPVYNAEGYTAAGNFRKADHFIHWDADQWFIRSTDGGATWRDLRKLNDPKQAGLAVQEITQTRHAVPSVAPDGRLHIVWEDRRHWYIDPSFRRAATTPGGTREFPEATNLANYPCVHTHAPCDEARLGDTYYTWSTDGGATFGPNRRVNDRSHNNDVGSDYRFSVYWDYGPAAVPLGNDELLVADMDARLGNFHNDSLDIFLRKVRLDAGTGAIPVESAATGNAPDFSAAFSRRAYPGGPEATLAGTFASGPMTKVVIVNENDPAAALLGSVLARANLGPVLASPGGGLPDAVKAEVARMDAIGAYVIGDTTALAPQVLTDLATAGVPSTEVRRIVGGSPAELASNVATALDRRSEAERAANPTVPSFDAAVIVNPNSASAAAASVLAASRRLPVLFVDQNGVPAATSAALQDLRIPRTLVVGSTGVISAEVAGQLPNPTRVGGGDQFATSRALVGESLAWGLPKNMVYVADGNKPMQAALMGAAVSRLGGLLVLTPGGSGEAAEPVVNDLALRPHVDRLVASSLTGATTVGPDPGDIPGLGPGPDPGDILGPGLGLGYRLVARDGGVFAFGAAEFLGSTGNIRLNQPIVGMAETPSGNGYWMVASDGGVFAFGDARFFGSTGSIRLNQPVVGMAATPSGNGYWLVARDGGIFAFGDARFAGSTGAVRLNQPVVGMAAAPSGNGYWLVASDGGIFAFGDARFAGSTGAIQLNQPVVGMAAAPSGNGYWLVASDGGIFAFGDARFFGSTGAIPLNQPMVGMDATPSGNGYWLVASDGGIFAFGDARFFGSTGAIRLNQPVVGIAAGD